jgi:membrane protein
LGVRWPRRASRVGLGLAKRFLAVRVTGLAAEMTYYALLSIFPLIAALGASLGFLERFVGSAAVQDAERTILQGVEVVFSPDVAADVITPLVQSLLEQERAGFALTSFLLSLFFASRVFRSAIDTLDSAFGVEERRGTIALWSLGLLFSIGAVVVGAVVTTMVVLDPLLGGGRALAERLGLGSVFAWTWSLARWPLVFVVATSFLAVLYRFGPNAHNSWQSCLPGAVLGMVGLILVSMGFRVYIELMGLQSPDLVGDDAGLVLTLQLIGALMAVLFWLWLSSIAILTGGVLSAELERGSEAH